MIVTHPTREELFAELCVALEIGEDKNKDNLMNCLWKLNRYTMVFLINKAKELREIEPAPKNASEGINLFNEVVDDNED